METMLKFFLISVLFFFTANASPFKVCGGSQNNVKSVEITGCTAAPCQLHHNTTVTFVVDFTAALDSKALTSKVYGVIGGVPVPFPIHNPDGCKGCGIDCPAKKGGTYTYKNTIAVLSSYPKLKVVVEWKLIGDGNKEEFCIMVPVEIVD